MWSLSITTEEVGRRERERICKSFLRTAKQSCVLMSLGYIKNTLANLQLL